MSIDMIPGMLPMFWRRSGLISVPKRIHPHTPTITNPSVQVKVEKRLTRLNRSFERFSSSMYVGKTICCKLIAIIIIQIDVIKFQSNLTRVSSANSVVSYTFAHSVIRREITRQMKTEMIPIRIYKIHLKSAICLAKMVLVRAKPTHRMVVDFRQAIYTHHYSASNLAS